ncbi:MULTISPECIES: hypothetical protein [unclassified Curtobacterium]|uniref:hypothetical protein n=1 Tax=unclassified Curtobacterium TaxID=257496 RepID=UPI0009F3E324|nr:MULTISPECIES: hypothetical protein [unclassified Curtobacterium]
MSQATIGTGRQPRSRKAGKAASVDAVTVAPQDRQKRQRGSGQPLTIGGFPSVDLLPPEVLVHRRERAVTRRLWLGVVILVLVAGAGVGVTAMLAAQAKTELARSQEQSLSILQQQQQYSDVRTTESSTSLLESAQAVGGSTQIGWGDYLAKVESSLPGGVSITGLNVDSASPIESYAQADAPLQGSRIATLTLDVATPTLPSLPEWLDSVKGLPGFVDATANSVTLDPSSGSYTVNMTIHVNEKAYDRTYTKGQDSQ